MISVDLRRRAQGVAGALLVTAGLAFGTAFLAQNAAAQGTQTPAAAPAPVDPDAVVATLDGQPITEADLAVAEESFADQLQGLPDPQLRQALIDLVIDLRLVAKAAETAGLDQAKDFQDRLAFLRQRVLRAEYLQAQVVDKITDETLQQRYQEVVAGLDLPDEVRASHILVDTEDEAKAIITDIKGGGDFAAIAKEKSKDPGSGADGGDLGFFTADSMVEEFSKAAFAMDVGTVSETPVKSQFGWHVIKVVERRKQQPPSFDEAKEQIRTMVIQTALVAEMQKLREAAQIDVVGAPAAEEPAAPAPETPAQPQ